MNKNKLVHLFVISVFVLLYLGVSVISTIHVVDFFKLTNPVWLAISLAVAFEMGAAASLASLVVLDKMNKGLVWALFITLTAMQAMGNMYYAYVHAENYKGWIELFGLIDQDVIFQKRILAAVSGAILPLVALGFIKSLVDYIKPDSVNKTEPIQQNPIVENTIEVKETKTDTNEKTAEVNEPQTIVSNIESVEEKPVIEEPQKIEEKSIIKEHPKIENKNETIIEALDENNVPYVVSVKKPSNVISSSFIEPVDTNYKESIVKKMKKPFGDWYNKLKPSNNFLNTSTNVGDEDKYKKTVSEIQEIESMKTDKNNHQ